MDLRKPSGYFFVLLGAIVLLTGLFSPVRAPLTELNVDLYSGIAMLIFGSVLLLLARRAAH